MSSIARTGPWSSTERRSKCDQLTNICPHDLDNFRPWALEEAQAHIKSQVKNGSVTAVTGEVVQLPIGDHQVSLCCHSDSPGAIEIVTAARLIIDQFNKEHFS
jgi:hypothetical protein